MFVTGGMGGIGTRDLPAPGARPGTPVVAGCLPGYDRKDEWLARCAHDGFQRARRRGQRRRIRQLRRDVLPACARWSGRVDILVNNAGITRDCAVQAHDRARLGRRDQHQPEQRVQRHAPGDRRHGRARLGAHHQHLLGQRDKGQFGQTNYSAAKAGMHGFSKALAQEVVRKGVTVNTISPGYVETDMVMAIRAEVREQIVASIPMGRLAQARGNRRGGRVPRLRGGRLHHRRQHLDQRRHAHDVVDCPGAIPEGGSRSLEEENRGTEATRRRHRRHGRPGRIDQHQDGRRRLPGGGDLFAVEHEVQVAGSTR